MALVALMLIVPDGRTDRSGSMGRPWEIVACTVGLLCSCFSYNGGLWPCRTESQFVMGWLPIANCIAKVCGTALQAIESQGLHRANLLLMLTSWHMLHMMRDFIEASACNVASESVKA